MIKHRNNINILAELKPGQIVICTSTGHISLREDISVFENITMDISMSSISNSFEHYLNLFELVNSSQFKSQSNEIYPDLRPALNGLIILTETLQNNRVNTSIIDDVINVYSMIRNRLDSLNVRYPEFFKYNMVNNTYITVEKCMKTLDDIENDMNINSLKYSDKDKTSKILIYISMLKPIIKSCYNTITEKASNILQYIINLFNSVTNNNYNSNREQKNVRRTFISEDLLKKYNNEYNEEHIKVDINNSKVID